MVINTNIASLTAQLNLNSNNIQLQQAMLRLSSGMQINSAADNPSGLAIADSLTSQINGMTVASQNANNSISMVQTADGALSTLTSTLQTMRDLAVQASSFGTQSAPDRQKLQTEFAQLGTSLYRTIQGTQFNGMSILAGSLQNANFQIGANTASDNQLSVNISNMLTVPSLSALFGTNLSIGSTATSVNVRLTINAIDASINKVDNFRSNLGAVQNRLTESITNLETGIVNQEAARSRIMDANFASETSNLSRAQIIQQAGTAMLVQANQSTQSVLQLLK
jgi:flagellin